MRPHERPARPRIVANFAISVDGKISSSRYEGAGFSSRLDRDRVDQLRSEADAVIVGAGTIRSEDPPLHIRDPARRHQRREAGRPEELIVVVVSASGRIDPAARFLRDPAAARYLAVPEDLPDDALTRLAPAIDAGTLSVLRLGSGGVDLRALVARLAQRGCRTLLCEGGGELLASLLAADLLDELRVTLCPTLIGGRQAPTLVGGEGWPLAQRRLLQLVSCEQKGDELYLHYQVGHRETVADP